MELIIGDMVRMELLLFPSGAYVFVVDGGVLLRVDFRHLGDAALLAVVKGAALRVPAGRG
jgi:hypothetical protein